MDYKNYVPGFDYMKFFGCIFVVFSHVIFSSLIKNIFGEKIFSYGWLLITIFFFVSGFLVYNSCSKKEKPFKYVFLYALKYYAIYFILHFGFYLFHYINIYSKSGVILYKDFIYFLATLPLRDSYLIHLWFIPSLVLGIVISYCFFYIKKEKIGILIQICFKLFLVFFGDLFSVASISSFMSKLFLGTFCVSIGMLTAKHKDKIKNIKIVFLFLLSLALILINYVLFLLFDGNKIYSFFDTIILTFSVLNIIFCFFVLLLRVKNDKTKKYHKEITIFSGITYFFHYPLQILLGKYVNNAFLLFLGIISLTSLTSFLVCKKMK